MWLDAFKPKSRDMQIIGVPGVPGVTPPRRRNEYKDFGATPVGNTVKSRSVPGVPELQSHRPGTPGTPQNTAFRLMCSNDGMPRQPNEYKGFKVSGTPGTPVTPQKHNKPPSDSDTADMLALFELESVQQEIDAGYPADELHRLHNMTWEFMQADGMGYDEAIRIAAAIVGSTQVAACEASYADVMALFAKLRQDQPAPGESSPSDFDWLPANDDEIGADDVRVSRITLFMARGVTEGESRALADRLAARDLTGYDDRRVCLECVHLAGTVTSRRCAQWRKHGGTSAAIPADLADMLQRCAGFDPVRHDGGGNHA